MDCIEAVRIAKCSTEYRDQRPMLAGPMPDDVWGDGDTGLLYVFFRRSVPGPSEELVGFAVDIAAQRVVAAQAVTLKYSTEGWRTETSPL